MHGWRFARARTRAAPAVTVLALTATPWVVLVSTSLSLYLGNQVELGHQLAVLLPFFAVLAAALVLGAVLWLAADRTWARIGLWSYLLAGPWFLVVMSLRDVSGSRLDRPAAMAFALLVAGAGVALAVRAADPRRAAGYFALLGLLFVLVDGYRALAIERSPPGGPAASAEPPASGGGGPNIYHLVLDGFQGDVFSAVLTERLRHRLAGFVHFPNAAATYSTTIWSMASVFSGMRHDLRSSDDDFFHAAFNRPPSLLWQLRQAGYVTLAYSRKLYPVRLDGFDRFTQHADNTGTEAADNSAAFARLWLYRVLPGFGRDWLAARGLVLSPQIVDQFDAGTFLPDTAPVESHLSFSRYLRAEETLPARGRYTFIHLLIPHSPYVLDADCSTETGRASALSQSRCAVELVISLAERLQAMGRFEDSLIIVHGDHGERHRVEGGRLRPTSVRSPNALLLVKPPGPGVPLRTSDAAVSLLDVAPTVLAFLGRREAAHEGTSLTDEPAPGARPAERSYYVMNRRRARRYTVTGHDTLLLAEIIDRAGPAGPRFADDDGRVPIWPTDEVHEAEDGALDSTVDVRASLPGVSGRHISNGNARFGFRVEQAGTYVLRARLVTPGGNNDSSFVRLGEREPRPWRMALSKTWKWQSFPIEWDLGPGVHVVALEYREPVFLDQVELRRRAAPPSP